MNHNKEKKKKKKKDGDGDGGEQVLTEPRARPRWKLGLIPIPPFPVSDY